MQVTFNALVLITSCQMSARNEEKLKFVIFIYFMILKGGARYGCELFFMPWC